MSTVHIAGMGVEVPPHYRQRCAWCGAILVEGDLSRMAAVGEAPTARFFEAGRLVEVAGENPRWAGVLANEVGTPLPSNACARQGP